MQLFGLQLESSWLQWSLLLAILSGGRRNAAFNSSFLASNLVCFVIFSVATPADPRGEKSFDFLQILGGDKLLEKCRWIIF